MQEKIQLPYTLQTSVGMVLGRGLPQTRREIVHPWRPTQMLEEGPNVKIPRVGQNSGWLEGLDGGTRIGSFGEFAKQDWSSNQFDAISETAIACIRQKCHPNPKYVQANSEYRKRFSRNIDACRNRDIDVYQLIRLIKSHVRLDLEQAAAVVVSSLVNAGRLDDAAVLLKELHGVLAVADMSIDPEYERPHRLTLAQSNNQALAHMCTKLDYWCRKRKYPINTPDPLLPHSYRQLVALLLRVRSVRPRDNTRCLYIPAWLFKAAETEPPAHQKEYMDKLQVGQSSTAGSARVELGYGFPEKEPDESSIVLSKHGFRVVQSRVLRMYRFWDARWEFRNAVRQMEDTVMYSSGPVDMRLRETDDVAELAALFFARQRRLQLKVVSTLPPAFGGEGYKWSQTQEKSSPFLASGESGKLYQNSIRLQSTFEKALAKMVGADRLSALLAKEEDVVAQMDQTCLLMKQYVSLYGNGKKEALVYKEGTYGGSGRGPVDKYNMLCDVLGELKLRARSEGIDSVPGPVYKFLAKDIMQWNKSFGDDAFAGGRVHGWEGWLKDRGLG